VLAPPKEHQHSVNLDTLPDSDLDFIGELEQHYLAIVRNLAQGNIAAMLRHGIWFGQLVFERARASRP
jgi:hypothetical protein